jgi:predicted ribosome quality control (RQC) complex YloA/Tae2 family protein
MINFDSLCLKAFIEEYGHILEAGRIQKIQQPSRREILIHFRAFGESHKLYVNIDPKHPHLCITKNGTRPIEIPKQPPMFCMLLRKYLEGAKILQVKQPEHERIFEIFIESYNELGEKSPQVLAIELMGKHSNVILYNCENELIIGCAHNVGEEKSKDRELSGGLRYVYPTKKDKKNILKTQWEDFYCDFRGELEPEVLNSKYFDITIPLAKELIKASNNDAKVLYSLAQKSVDLEILHPSISLDGESFSLFSLDKNNISKEYISTNEMLDDYFGKYVAQDKLQTAKTPLLQVVNKEIKKQNKTLLAHQKTLDNAQKSEKYRIWADILTSNIHAIKEVEATVTLPNYYENNNPITIELDETLGLKDNIQRYYKLYNKTKTAKEYAQKLLEATALEIDYLESIKTAITQAESTKITNEIKLELSEKGLIKENQKLKPQKDKIELDFVEVEGYKIYIGKNNKQNDYIVSKFALGNDLWLHTFNIPGAHILVKMPKDVETPPDNVLRKASKLAVYYSQARNSVKVDVTCVRRKYLKKPPGANLGYVTFTNETNIIVDTNEQEN